MRNLKLLYHSVESTPTDQTPLAICLDSIRSNTYYGITEEYWFCARDREKEVAENDCCMGLGQLVGFEYRALDDNFSLAVHKSLIVYNPSRIPFQEPDDEELAAFSFPIMCMKWSPDQEIVVVVTSDFTCFVLDSGYQTLAETLMVEDDFGDEEFVNVGWGKKETQFHGSAGKHSRVAVVTGVPITDDPAKDCAISWRGDGAYFVVILTNYENQRLFKVFDKEGALKFTSEPCHGLDGPVSWRPSGLWIAVPQLLADEKYCIALFERNGLRHRELILPFKRTEERVTALEWSLDSEVLMVVTKSATKNMHKIYLYTINNYHWYLKQTLQFETEIAHVKWDLLPANGKTLHVFLANAKYHKFK